MGRAAWGPCLDMMRDCNCRNLRVQGALTIFIVIDALAARQIHRVICMLRPRFALHCPKMPIDPQSCVGGNAGPPWQASALPASLPHPASHHLLQVWESI